MRFTAVMLLLISNILPGRGIAALDDSAPDLHGVVVEALNRHQAAQKAGLQEGDLILSCRRGGANGPIDSPFDLTEVEIEQNPRGPVTLQGLRGGQKKIWAMGPAEWGLKTRPQMDGPIVAAYAATLELCKSGKQAEAAQRMRSISITLPAATWLRSWALSRAADFLVEGRQWKDADTLYQEAVQEATKAGPGIAALQLQTWARSSRQANDLESAARHFQEAVDTVRKIQPENLTLASGLFSLGSMALLRSHLEQAEKYYQQSLSIRSKLAPASLSVAEILRLLGSLEDKRRNLEKAEDYYRKSLALAEKLDPEGIVVMRSFNGLGIVAWRRGKLAVAQEYYQRALAIAGMLDPESVDVADILGNLSSVSSMRGDLAGAEEYQRQNIAIRERLEPGSLSLAADYSNSAGLMLDHGNLSQAEDYLHRALAIQQQQSPDSLNTAVILTKLGEVAEHRGEWETAEKYFLQSIAIEKRVAPDSLEVAGSLFALAQLAHSRGNLLQAERDARQALAMQERLAPDSIHTAMTTHLLGQIAYSRGDFAQAKQEYERSLALAHKIAPDSLEEARSLDSLGGFYKSQDDPRAGEKYVEALAIEERIEPESFEHAATLSNLGTFEITRKDLVNAEKHLRQALAIEERLAPGTSSYAQTLKMLADVSREQGDTAKFEEYFRQALSIEEKTIPGSATLADDQFLFGLFLEIKEKLAKLDEAGEMFEKSLSALEAQMTNLGGAEDTRMQFRGRRAAHYQNYIDLLMRQKQIERAFNVQERLRARSLSEMLDSAKIDIRRGVDPQLIEQQRQLRMKMDDLLNRQLQGRHSQAETRTIREQIDRLQAQAEEIEEQIRAASPTYAALAHPQPLTLKQVQEQLVDSNTLLLEYSLGSISSYVWAVTDKAVTAYRLPNHEEIKKVAIPVYDLLTARNLLVEGETLPERVARLQETARKYPGFAAKLSEMVLGPVAGSLEGKRLVIVTDGVLQLIPFSLLPDPRATAAAAPLIATHEVTYLPSSSVLSELRRRAKSRPVAPKLVAVFADPVFERQDVRVKPEHLQKRSIEAAATAQPLISPDLAQSLADLNLTRGGGELIPRLLNTRREAEAIVAVAPPEKRLLAVDFAANLDAATSSVLAQYRIIHFATHGLLDPAHPERSGLVLSLVDEAGRSRNGFLETQTIYNLNLSADLVVLSACQTGIGKNVQGEGLLAVTRGFMYAGASRVVATLWSVDDEATAELMGRFYKALLVEKLSPAAALRRAQMQLLQDKRWTDPFFWAPFVLQGDWQSFQ